MTYHFPDAYAGSNTKIRDTLNNLILKSPQNWRECRPFEPSHGAHALSPLFCVPRRDERRAPLLPDSGHCRRVGMRRTRLLEPLGLVVRAPAHPPPPPLQDEVRFDVRLMQRVPYGALAPPRAPHARAAH